MFVPLDSVATAANDTSQGHSTAAADTTLGRGEEDADVNELLRNYFGSLEAKDEDIFRLYADNQRMRDLVEASCVARQELDTRLHTTQVLVSSLKTELNEKRCLVEAQEAEAAAFRDGIADLRVVLGKPSELDFTLDDCVAEVEYMVENDRQRQRHAQHLNASRERLAHWVADMLDESEKRERAALEETALTTTRVLATSAALSADDAARVEAVEGALEAQHAQLLDAQAQQSLAAQTTQNLATVWQRELGDKTEALQSAQRQVRQLHDCREADQREAALGLQAAHATVDALMHRTLTAEGLLVTLHTTSKRLACDAAATHAARAAERERECETLRDALRHECDTHAATRVQLDKEAKARQQLATVQEGLLSTQAALEVIKVKYTAHLEKASLQRQRQALLDKKHQEELAVSEEKAERHTRHTATLQGQLDNRDEDLQRAHKALQQKERQVAVLEAQLDTVSARVGVLESALADAQDAQEALQAHHHAVQRETLEDMEAATRAIVHHAETDARAQLLTLEKAASQREAAHVVQCAHVVETYKAELCEWAAIAEEAKAHAYAVEQDVHRERQARQLLEAQQRTETTLQKQIVWRATEQARLASAKADEDDRKSRAAAREGASVIDSLRRRVQTLEEAAEASAVAMETLSVMRHGTQPVPARGWRSAECALLDRIDRAMEASTAEVTTPSRVVQSPSDLFYD